MARLESIGSMFLPEEPDAVNCAVMGTSWAEIARHISPSRFTTKPLERHYQCLRNHISQCEQYDELLSAAIALTQMDKLPFQYECLLRIHQLHIVCRQEAKTCREAVSPIHWLPNEILAEIFILCLPIDHRFYRNDAPLILCQISAWWRNVATTTPTLWSDMSFWTPPFSNTDLTCYPSHLMHQWCSYSRNTSLSLFFEQGLAYHHLKLFSELVLRPHASQCRHLELHLTRETAFALIHFVTLPSGSLSRLESLVLENFDEADFAFHDQEDPIITVFRESPLLQKITTNLLNFTFENGAASEVPKFDLSILPWGGLTHFMITGFVKVDIFATVLSQCAALQFLRVSLELDEGEEQWDTDEWCDRQRVTLPCLTELYITLADGLCIPPPMDIFDFPALEFLKFRRLQGLEPIESPDFFSWTDSWCFRRQLHNIKQLSLVGRVGSPEQVITLLQSTPSLTTLALDIWTDYQSVIPALFPLPDPLDQDTDFTLPFLSSLELRLEQPDFPFPSQHIAAASEYSVSLKSMAVFHQVGFQTLDALLEMSQSFDLCRLKPSFWILDASTRFGGDWSLIDDSSTNRDYQMYN